jgi:hypothetical protein
LVAVKKVLGKLLTPILERQSAYNAASARVTTHIKDRIETLARQQALVSEQIETFERRQAEFQDTVSRTQVESFRDLRESVQFKLPEETLFKLREEILAAQSQALHEMHSQLRPALDLLGSTAQ